MLKFVLGPPPPFTLDRPRFDPNTYKGRTLTFLDQTTGDLIFVGQDRIDEAKAKLAAWAVTKPPITDEATLEDLWRARKIIDGCVHPDTGETVFPLVRFAAFPPVNYLLVPIMLHPAVMTSVVGTIGIHWANQSYNCAVNFANRNASNPISTQRLLEAYGAAVGASVSIALGATFLTRRAARLGPSAATAIRVTLPFFAVAAAGFANVGLIRRNELVDGVTVTDEDGNARGKSVEAGKVGLAKCGLARVLWNLPTMTLAPLTMAGLKRLPLFAKSPKLSFLTEWALLCAAIRYGVPPALAVFPQKDKIETSKLESQFRDLKDKNGRPIQYLYYNKGL